MTEADSIEGFPMDMSAGDSVESQTETLKELGIEGWYRLHFVEMSKIFICKTIQLKYEKKWP